MAKSRLRVNLGTFTAKAKNAAEKALLQTAADVTDLAKQLCPVDTGNLKNSIGALPIDSQTVQVGTDVDYGKYQEYGTVKMAAQPFLTPAFAQSTQTFEKRFADALKEEFNA